MASLQNFYTSRDNNANASTYVGQLDRLWYNPTLNSIYVSDGSTPGGIPVGLATGANAIFTNITVNGAVLGDLDITGNISPAGNGKVGGITPGPGINISDTGLLTIDSGGLPISFGDFYANVNVLSMVNANEDMVLQSNGTGNINLIGGLNVFDPNGAFGDQPILRVNQDGQIRMLVPLADSTTGALEIVGNDSGDYFPPTQTGVILHVTGNDNLVARNYLDASNNYALLAGRRYNGNVASPTQVLAGQSVFRVVGQGVTPTGFETFGLARLDFVATQNQAANAQGGEIQVYATANNNPGTSAVNVATFNGNTGVTVTTLTSTGNVTGGNIITAGQVTSTGNVTGGGLTTAGFLTGRYVRTTRNAGVIADGGTLTIDFSTDAIVYCTWANGMSLAYSNYTAGRVVKVICTKAAGSGTDSINLDGLTASHVSSGSTTVSGTADTTQFIELTCVNTDIGNVFAKL